MFTVFANLDALSAPELLKPLLVTLKPARTEQRGHMLRLDLNWKACGLENPKDTEGSKAWIHELAKKNDWASTSAERGRFIK